MPSVSPTSCDQYIDFLREECEENQRPLRDSYAAQQQSYDGVVATEQECSANRNAISPVIELLTDYAVKQWQDAVDTGLDCQFVPSVVCKTNRVNSCQIVGDVCTYYNPSTAPTSTPSFAPSHCDETPEYWEDAVNNGRLLCMWVPIEVCTAVTKCEINADGDCQNVAQSGNFAVLNQNVNGFDLSNEIINPVATGSIYYYVTESGNDAPSTRQMFISSRRILTAACTGKLTQTATQTTITTSVECTLSGGSTYVLYVAADVDSKATQLTMLSGGDITFELQ